MSEDTAVATIRVHVVGAGAEGNAMLLKRLELEGCGYGSCGSKEGVLRVARVEVREILSIDSRAMAAGSGW